ncbi:basic amino acid/polyamine antiporter [Photobacterium sp. J15]|uniref:basic amino acid/polyamine antiporter n=1 Tax=Photobacterium sp. J15 TaxID=265901 RepID=UPI0007E4D7E8|nr:basic amino acid/polyamine antiporter [Photobacterium sp. J15]
MNNQLGLGSLTALVLSTMLGAGIFSLPQNMAAGAGPGAVIIGWLITGVGMLALVRIFYSLSVNQPHINGGVIAYAKAGFGDFWGFNSAWGFWLNTILANTSYAVVVFSALSFFTDTPDNTIFGAGNTWQSVLGASILIWMMHFLVTRGVKEAAIVNMVVTIAKLIPLLTFIGYTVIAANFDKFSLDIWAQNNTALGGLGEQVRYTMSITLWVFIGIEGAVMLSRRAKSRKAIGQATVIALLAALSLYVIVTLFSYGVMTQEELAELQNPSMARILEHIVGPWGALLINLGLITSVCGALLSWTVITAEAPLVAAESGLFPRVFGKENRHGAPIVALTASTLAVQSFLIMTMFSQSTYLSLVNIATSSVLIPYGLSAAYGLKVAIKNDSYGDNSNARRLDLIGGMIATVYGSWLVYAAGLHYLLLVALLYFPGLLVMMWARKEQQKAFINSKQEVFGILLLTVMAVGAVFMMTVG